MHCRRDAQDTCPSCFATDFSEGQEWSFDLAKIGAYCGFYLELMAHWRRVLPLEIHELEYEALVADLEGESRGLVEFCGLDWHPDCLKFRRAQRPVLTASSSQVRQPLYASSVGRCPCFEKQLGSLIENLPPECVA